jgi:hypothetical protein
MVEAGGGAYAHPMRHSAGVKIHCVLQRASREEQKWRLQAANCSQQQESRRGIIAACRRQRDGLGAAYQCDGVAVLAGVATSLKGVSSCV